MTETTLNSERTEDKKPGKEILIVHEEGEFLHATGDVYQGGFEAKKKDFSVKMQGAGAYKTCEGDVYTGKWELNALSAAEKAKIEYIDGSTYEGYVKDWSYAGKARYVYPDQTVLECDFVENCPKDHLKIVDPNGQVWLGKAETGFCWVQPINHYFDMLESTLETDKKRRNTKGKRKSPNPEK